MIGKPPPSDEGRVEELAMSPILKTRKGNQTVSYKTGEASNCTTQNTCISGNFSCDPVLLIMMHAMRSSCKTSCTRALSLNHKLDTLSIPQSTARGRANKDMTVRSFFVYL